MDEAKSYDEEAVADWNRSQVLRPSSSRVLQGSDKNRMTYLAEGRRGKCNTSSINYGRDAQI